MASGRTAGRRARYDKEKLLRALDLLKQDPCGGAGRQALSQFATEPGEGERATLAQVYHYYASDPYRRDSGAYVRSAILQAWRPLARADDVPLLERALLTYEFPPPGRTEGAASLRAAALVTLSDLEPGLAAYHAVRLLADKHNSAMSGEPGVTAARVLASQGEMLPLYACAVAPTGVRVEVVSECLRSLVRMPGSLLPALVEQYQRTSDEIVLVGLFDLILGHEDGAKQTPFLLSFLQETHLHDAYRYLVTVIVAGRHAHLLSDLIALARHESDRLKRRALAEALSLLAGDPEVDAVLADLQKDGHDGR